MISPSDLFLRGTCLLQVDNNPPARAACFLDLKSQKLTCQRPGSGPWDDFGERRESIYRVTKLEILSPLGVLNAESISVAFASRTSDGGYSVHRTEITELLGTNATVSMLDFVINEPISFDSPLSIDEKMYFPGFNILGSIELTENLAFTGAKEYISITNNTEYDSDDVKAALEVSIGAPLSEFASHKGNKFQIVLNHYEPSENTRPIIFCGWPYWNLDEVRSNLRSCFCTAIVYISSLSQHEKEKMKNAVSTFLEGRIVKGKYELKLLAAFHFLEWFDRTSRVSPNALMDRFSIRRCEADGIKLIRDAVIHNTRYTRDAVNDGMNLILKSDSDFVKNFSNRERSRAFINYIYTLLGDVLAKEVGYTGKTQPYLPY